MCYNCLYVAKTNVHYLKRTLQWSYQHFIRHFYLWCSRLHWETPGTSIFWERTLKGTDLLLSESAAESSSSEICTLELRKKKPTPNRTQTQPNANTDRKDTVAGSDVRHPAATPACQRVTGWWPSAGLQWADPDCLCSAHRAGRLQRPGYSWSLWQTAEKTWGKEGGINGRS